MEVAHLRGVALLDNVNGLLEAADPALDRGDELSREGALPGVDGEFKVVVDVEDRRRRVFDLPQEFRVFQ